MGKPSPIVMRRERAGRGQRDASSLKACQNKRYKRGMTYVTHKVRMSVEGYSILLVHPRLSLNSEEMDENLVTSIKFIHMCTGVVFNLHQLISWESV